MHCNKSVFAFGESSKWNLESQHSHIHTYILHSYVSFTHFQYFTTPNCSGLFPKLQYSRLSHRPQDTNTVKLVSGSCFMSIGPWISCILSVTNSILWTSIPIYSQVRLKSGCKHVIETVAYLAINTTVLWSEMLIQIQEIKFYKLKESRQLQVFPFNFNWFP